MRTLKKTLCLVLALVMMLGLCAVSASATAFTDDDEIAAEYQEAVEVVSAIGVINGKGDGSTFDPKGTLTRVQGSYLITYLLKADTGATATRFNDVNLEDVGVVEWMAANKIADGRDDAQTIFDPDSTMTGKEFAKWLLTSLGYDAERETLSGPYWEGGVRILTAKVGLSRGIDSYDQNAPITREEAAQMCLNALEANMVEYGEGQLNNGSFTVNLGAQPIRSNAGKDYAGDTSTDPTKTNLYIQLCEMYHPQLTKAVKPANNVSKEDLNRPLESIWSYKGAELYKVQAAPAKVYTDKVKAEDLPKEMSDYYIESSDTTPVQMYVNSYTWSKATGSSFRLYVNGAAEGSLDKSATNDNITISSYTVTLVGTSIATMISDLTGKGRVVEIYTDKEDPYKIIQINVNCYTVAEITDLKTEKGVTTYTLKPTKTGAAAITAKTYADAPRQNELITDDALAKNDIVLITTNTNVDLAAPSGDVKLYAYAAEKRTGTQSSFTDTKSKQQITVDGTAYSVAEAVAKNADYDGSGNLVVLNDFKNNNTKEIDFYLDTFGYVVYAKEVKKTSTASGNYVFIVEASGYLASEGLNVGTPTVEVRAVFSDGSYGEYEVKTETVDVNGKTKINGVDVENKTIDRYYPVDGTTYEKTDVSGDDEPTANYYIISGTDIIIGTAANKGIGNIGGGSSVEFEANADDKTCVNNAAKLLMSDIYGYVYEYELKDKVLTLKPIGNSEPEDETDHRYGDNYVDGSKVKDKTYTGQTTSEVVKGVLGYKTAASISGGPTSKKYGVPTYNADGSANTNTTVVVNESTKFILYNSVEKKVDVKTLSDLPAVDAGAVGYYVATASTDKRLNASVVFCVKAGKFTTSATSTDEIVFVKLSDRGQTLVENGDKSVTEFNAWTLDGNRLPVTWEGNPSGIAEDGTFRTGLYKIDEKGKITGSAVLKTGDSNTITVDSPYFYEANGEGARAYVAEEDAILSGATTDAEVGANNMWLLKGKTPVNGGDITKDKLYVIVRTSGSDILPEVAYVFTA